MGSWILFLLVSVQLPETRAQEPVAELFSRFPNCALSCLGDVIGHTRRSMTDRACICTDQNLQDAMAVCVLGNCTVQDALVSRKLTATACHEPVRDKTRDYVSISNAFGITSAVFVILRFAYKLWAKLEFGLDDWFTLICIVTGVPSTVINAHGVAPNGMGRDAWTLTFIELTNFARFFYVMEIIYLAEVALLKLSLLFFYIRIFPGGAVRRLLWGTVAFVSVFGVVFVSTAIFQCAPIDAYWRSWDVAYQGRCLDINAIAWSNAAISISLDVWMLAIPLWQLRTLNLDWKKKIGVAMMFGVGTFVTIVSIFRLRSLVKFGSSSANPTWEFFDIGIWSTVEINVGIICACLPSLRLILMRIFPKIIGTTDRYHATCSSDMHRPATAQKQSRMPGAPRTMSRAERSRTHEDVKSSAITLQTIYTVEYGLKT